MVLFVNSDDSIIYATNHLISKEEIKKYPDAIWYDGDFSFEQGEEKEGYTKLYKWDGEKPIIEYIPTPEPELSQLDRMEAQLMKSQDEIRQEGADMVMEEMQKRGLIV